jgi:hypothetical protein
MRSRRFYAILAVMLISRPLLAVGPENLVLLNYLNKNTGERDSVLFPGEQWNGIQNDQENGGSILQFSIPFGPTSSPVYFIGSSLRNTVRGTTWSVYLIKENSKPTSLTNDLEFVGGGLPAFFLNSEQKPNPVLSVVTTERAKVNVMTLQIDGSGTLQIGNREGITLDLDDSSTEERKDAVEKFVSDEKLGVAVHPQVQAISLFDYLRVEPILNWNGFFSNGIPSKTLSLPTVKGQHLEQFAEVIAGISPHPAINQSVSKETFTPARAAELWKQKKQTLQKLETAKAAFQ